MARIATLTMNPALDVSTSIDRVVPTRKLHCGPPRFDAGGGGINVAKEIRALGGGATAVFAAGGPAGARIEALLEASGVDFRAVPIAGDTRESLTVNEESTGDQFRFVLPGPGVSPAEEDAILACLAEIPADYLVVSGSFAPGTRKEFAERVAGLARERGARLVLDMSGDFLCWLKWHAWLAKPSLDELQRLAGSDLRTEKDIVDAARHLIADGHVDGAVVVSLGEDGAILVTADTAERFEAVKVEAVSAVGAGDAMVAGITLGASRGLSLRDAVRYGIAAGAATLLGPGTETLKREDAERLYQHLLARNGG